MHSKQFREKSIMGHEGLFGIRKNNAPSIFFPSFWTLNSKPFFFCKFVLLDSTWETHTSPLLWLSTLEAHPTTPSPDSPGLRVPPPREGRSWPHRSRECHEDKLQTESASVWHRHWNPSRARDQMHTPWNRSLHGNREKGSIWTHATWIPVRVEGDF